MHYILCMGRELVATHLVPIAKQWLLSVCVCVCVCVLL